MCGQTFLNQAERDLHSKSEHPTDASGSYYLPVERYQPKRAPASSGTASKPTRTDTIWFEQNPIGQTRAHSKRTTVGPSDVQVASATGSITAPGSPAAGKMDLETVVADQAAVDKPSRSSTPEPHKKMKRRTCPTCKTLFASRTDRNAHRKTCNTQSPIPSPGIASTLCVTCNRDFLTPNALELHRRNSTVHGVRHCCKVCSSHFFTPGALVVHGVLAHGLDLPCDLCNEWFATEEQRAEHVKATHNKPAQRVTAGRKKRVSGPGPMSGRPSPNMSGGTWAGLFGGGGTTTQMGVRSHRYSAVPVDEEKLSDLD